MVVPSIVRGPEDRHSGCQVGNAERRESRGQSAAQNPRCENASTNLFHGFGR